ncbi:DUF6524 family protein [Acidimangrovimonas pyrenivorans]|uniref:DUF6524 family protein n=1 Tax=Acidimangrovimonas pyrenivorans TaxID=2030798 RepID=A0ABV7ABP1_9RHOB
MGFFMRWLAAFVLLASTYNPTQWNYVSWIEANYAVQLPLAVLMGLLLTVAYMIYLRATLRSIGSFGMIMVIAILAALIWVLIDWGVLTLDNPDLNLWLGIFVLSFVLGIGLSWSLVRRRLTGQADVDDLDE